MSIEKTIGPRLVYKSTVKTKCIFLYLALWMIGVAVITALGGWASKNFYLSILTMIYWTIVIIPIIITEGRWYHPLMLQMIYKIPEVASLGTRAIGYVEPNYNFRNYISNGDAIKAYAFSVFITCLGLIIEYIVVCAYKPGNLKRKRLVLKNSKGIAVLFAFSVLCFLLLMHQLGGLFYVLRHYGERLVEFSSRTSAYLRYFIKYGILCVFYYYLLDRKNVFYFTGIILILIYIIIGERGGLISTILIPFSIVYMLKKEKNFSISQITLGGVGLTFIYVIFGIMRDTTQNVTLDYFLRNIVMSLIHEFSRILHFVISTELIWMVCNGGIGHTYGKPLLNILVAPFPRSIFSWKPKYIAESFYVGSLILGAEKRIYGLPPGPFAYGYLNFGFLGLIIFAIICGRFMGYMYNSLIGEYQKRRERIPNGNILLYAVLLPFSMEILSTECQINILIYLIGITFVFYTARDRRKS